MAWACPVAIRRDSTARCRVLLLVPATLRLLASAVAAGASSSGADTDDRVELQLDLPPDVQRMFEEMCELENISQSDMLTRWIDARWEAMGYTDADLEGIEATDGALVCGLAGNCSSEDVPTAPKTPAAPPAPAGAEQVAPPSVAPPAPARVKQQTFSSAERMPGGVGRGGSDPAAGGKAGADKPKRPAKQPSAAQPAGGSANNPKVATRGPSGARGQATAARSQTDVTRSKAGQRLTEDDEAEEDNDDDEDRGMPDLDEWMRRRSEDDED